MNNTNIPETTNITPVSTYATRALTTNDATGTAAIPIAVFMPEIRARYSYFICFMANTFIYALISAIVYPMIRLNTPVKM